VKSDKSLKEVRVAVIGIGKMGILHAAILSSMPTVRLVAICDKKKLITKLAKGVLSDKVKVVNDVGLLSDLALDAVYVTTPIPFHFKTTESVYTNDIARNIFVEKTLAPKSTEAEELCKIAKDFGGVNMVGYQRRYSVTFRKALELLDKNAIGNLTRFSAYSYSSDLLLLKKGKVKEVSASRGDVLKDLGAHAIDLALWYFGNLRVTFSETKPQAKGYRERARETIGFHVEASSGVGGYIESSWCKEGYRMPETGLTIEGSEGVLFVNDDSVEVRSGNGDAKRWYRQDLNDTVDFLLWAPEYYREDYQFIKCAAKGELSKPDFLEASKVDHIIEQVTQGLC
jgi:predicted dehydrogenase